MAQIRPGVQVASCRPLFYLSHDFFYGQMLTYSTRFQLPGQSRIQACFPDLIRDEVCYYVASCSV